MVFDFVVIKNLLYDEKGCPNNPLANIPTFPLFDNNYVRVDLDIICCGVSYFKHLHFTRKRG